MAVDNIKVAIRVRALIAREVNAGAKVRWIIRDNTIYQDDPECKDSCFVFDSISDHRKSNLDVFNEVARPIVAGVMQGINGSVFAYGQTSSGKTYTMLGDSQAEGIIPLAIQEIFETIENTPDREFLLRVSYMEIYNEEIQDLLTGAKNLKIRETAEKEIYVGDLKEQLVTDAQQIYKLMHQGEQRRHTGATNMNEHSSRSHTIFRVIVESRQRVCTGEESDLAVNVSHMNLVDLAGSERTNQTGATGDRFKEGCAINKSLFTLGYVICKLSEGESYVPFRDSKLTRILQNSLGGNSKTAIICTVTPAAVDETVSTLKFASRAKNIRNRPTVNEVLSDEALLRRYRMQIQELQKQLSCSTPSLDSNHPDVAALEQQLAEKSRKESELRSLVDKLTQIICVSHSGSHSDQSSQAVGVVKKDKRRETWCPGKQPTRWNAFDDVGANFPKRRALQSDGGDDFGFVQSPEDMLNAAERCRIAEMDASEPTALPPALMPSPSVADAPVLAPDAVPDLDVASISVQADIDNPLLQELEKQVFMLREENMLLKNLMEELECDLKHQHGKDVANLQQALQAAEWQRDELLKKVSSMQHDKSEPWEQNAGPASPQVAADAQTLDEALQVALLHSQLYDTGRLLEAKLEENARLVGQVDELVAEKTRLAQELEALKPRLGEQNNSLWAYETIESITDALSHLEVELSDLRSKNHNRSTSGVTNLSVQTTPSLHRVGRATASERTPVTPRTRTNNSVILDSVVVTNPENKILIDGLLAAQSRLNLLLDEARQLSDELGGQQQDAPNPELEAHIKFLEGECSRLQSQLDVTAKHRDDLLAQISKDGKAPDVANTGDITRLASLEKGCESLRQELEVITRERQGPLAAVHVVCRNEPVPAVSSSASVPVKLVEANDLTIFDSSCLDMTTYMDVLREQHTLGKVPSLYEELRSATGTYAASPRPSMDSVGLDQDSRPQVPHADADIVVSQELAQARALVADLESERDILKAVNLTLERQLHNKSTTLTTVDCQTSPYHPGGWSPQHGDRKVLPPSAAAVTTPTVAVVLPQCYVIPEPPVIAVEQNIAETVTNDDAASMPTNERATCIVQPLEEDSASKCPEPAELQQEATAREKLAVAESEAARLRAALEEQLRIEACYMEAIAELRKDLDDMAAKLAVAEEENRRLRDSTSEAASNKEPLESCGSCQDLPCDAPTMEARPSAGEAGSVAALAAESGDALQSSGSSASGDDIQPVSPAAALDELTTMLSASADENTRLRSELDARSLEIKQLSASLNAAECKARDDAVAYESLQSRIQEQHGCNADLLEKLTRMTAQIDELSAKLLASADENVKLQSEVDARSMEIESLTTALNAAECRARDDAMATESLRCEIKEQYDRNAGLVDRVAELTAQNAEMSSTLLSSETVTSELRCELKSEKAEKLRIQEKIELITRETDTSASKLAVLVDENSQLKSHIGGLNDEMENLKSELASVDILLAESQANAEFMTADFKEQLKHEREHASGLANEVKQLSEQLAANEKRLQLAEAESADLRAITGEQQREVSELHARITQLEDCLAHEEAQRLQDKKRAEEALKSKDAQLVSAQASYRQDLADKMAELGRKELKLQTIEREHEKQLRKFADLHLRNPAGSTPASTSRSGGACDAGSTSLTTDDSMASLREKYDSAVKQAQQFRGEIEQLETKLRQLELQQPAAAAAATEQQHWKALVDEKDEQTERLQGEVQRLARCCEQANKTLDGKRAQCDELTATLAALREQLRAMERDRDERPRSQACDDSLRSSTFTTQANSSSTSTAVATSSDTSATVARAKYEYAVQKATEFRKEKGQLAEKVKELQVKLETPSEYWKAIINDKEDRIERLEAEVQRVMRCCEDADNELDDEKRQHDELKVVVAELRERLSRDGSSSKLAANQSSTAAADNFELRLKVEQLEREVIEQARPLKQRITELSKEAASLRERCTFFKNEARRLQTSPHDVTVGMKTQANATTQCDFSPDRQRLLGAGSESAAGGGPGTWNPSLPLQPPGCGIVEELERDRLRQEVQRLRRQLRQAQALQPPSAQVQHGPAAAAACPTSIRAAVTATTEAVATELMPSIVPPLHAGGSKLPATSAKALADVQPPRPALSGITNSPKRTLQGHTKFFPAVSKPDSPQATARGPIKSNQPQLPAVDDDITGCKQQ